MQSVWTRTSTRVLWRRALARVERRALPVAEAMSRCPEINPHVHLTREGELLRQAARLANTLALMTGCPS